MSWFGIQEDTSSGVSQLWKSHQRTVTVGSVFISSSDETENEGTWGPETYRQDLSSRPRLKGRNKQSN